MTPGAGAVWHILRTIGCRARGFGSERAHHYALRDSSFVVTGPLLHDETRNSIPAAGRDTPSLRSSHEVHSDDATRLALRFSCFLIPPELQKAAKQKTSAFVIFDDENTRIGRVYHPLSAVRSGQRSRLGRTFRHTGKVCEIAGRRATAPSLELESIVVGPLRRIKVKEDTLNFLTPVIVNVLPRPRSASGLAGRKPSN